MTWGPKMIGILGGGLTGLTLGYFLRQKGIDFEIFEKETECGGLMKSIHEEGFTFDYGGSHIIFSKDTEILRFMLDLLGENKIRKRRNTKILYDGNFIKYPFENGLSDLPKEENFECLKYFVQNLIRKERGEANKPNNLRDWFYYTFGKGITEKYLIPYNEKIWKYPLEKTGLEWVERIPNPPVEDIIKSSLGIETEGYTHQLFFYYPKVGGIQALIKSLEEKISKNINTGFEVKKIKKDDEWVVSNGVEERFFDRVVSTIPIFELVDMVDMSNEVKEAAGNLKFNSLITILLGLETPKVNDFSWLYIPDADVLTHRVSFPSNYTPYAAPKRKSSVLAEITCNIGDNIWRMKEQEIISRTIDDLHRLKIINKEGVCFAKMKKVKYAYIINDLYYSKNVEIVTDHLTRSGIDLVGRFAEFRYLNMDACIRNAMGYTTKNDANAIHDSK